MRDFNYQLAFSMYHIKKIIQFNFNHHKGLLKKRKICYTYTIQDN